MWTIREVKDRGKAAMKANYWTAVLAGFLTALAFAGTGFIGSTHMSTDQYDQISAETLTNEQAAVIIVALAAALLVVVAVSSVVRVFVANPLLAGCRHFFHKNLQAPAAAGELGWGFKNRYGRNVMTYFRQDLYILLWSMLFIVPGIVKSYSYRFVPYILEDHPEASPSEVITMSRRMMDGNKMKAFTMDLSFIGWFLLTAVTFGLAGIFYGIPYHASTDAAMYEAVRAQQA